MNICKKNCCIKSFKIDIIYAKFDTLIPPVNALRLAKINRNFKENSNSQTLSGNKTINN